MAADTIVIGGGVMGLCTALCLRRAGAGVVLVEKSHVGAGASGRSGAILRQHYSNALTVAMARDGLRAYADFEGWAGGPSGFRRVGCLILADARDRTALEGNVGLMRAAGCDASLVTPADIRRFVPMVEVPDGALGAWEPDAGYADPLAVLATLEAACRREGVRIESGAEVVALGAGAAPSAILGDGRRLEGGAVVVTAGPWTGRLLAPLGYEAPIRTTRPLLAFFARPADLPEHPVVGDLLSGVYFRPDAERTLVGALDLSQDDDVPDPDALDETVPAEFVAFARERVLRRLPALERGYGRGGYAGFYDCTPDMHPVLGAVPDRDRVFVAAGFSGHGFKLAPVVGQAMADLVTVGRFTGLDLTALRPERYAQGAPVRAAYEYGLLG